MHEPSGPAWLVWLELTGLAQAMRTSLWMYPIVEIVHIVGFVIVVGAVLMFDLRVLGLGRALPVDALARHLLRWAWLGLVLVVPAGLMMFAAHATEFAANPAFLTKLALIVLAGVNMLMFHRGPFRTVAAWDRGPDAPRAARAGAAVSIVLWLGVIACGRLLAYL